MRNPLRAAIAAEIDRVRAANVPTEKRRYKWPLARPTWTAEECEEAVRPWIDGNTTMWGQTANFEALFAAAFGYVGGAAMCNSGSSADFLAALLARHDALPRHHGMRDFGGFPCAAVMPAVTWPTQLWALLWAGFEVRLVDVDPATLTCRPQDVRAAMGALDDFGNTAVFATHLLGLPWDMDAIAALCDDPPAALIEDCCEALGAKWRGRYVGTFGRAGTHSLFLAHHLSTGEGGVVGVNDPADLDLVRAMRAHGWTRNCTSTERWADELQGWDGDPRYTFVEWGGNFRPMESQARVGILQLGRWHEIEATRARVACAMLDAVADAPGCRTPTPLPGAEPSWFAVPILCESKAARIALVDRLEAEGVETRAIVAGNLARQPVLASGDFRDVVEWGPLPGADAIHDTGLYVGILADATDAELNRVCEVLRRGA